MPMDPEERELQIKLAQMQTNIQIWFTLGITFFAAGVASLIAEWQIITLPDDTIFKALAIILFGFFAILSMALSYVSFRKYNSCHMELMTIN